MIKELCISTASQSIQTRPLTISRSVIALILAWLAMGSQSAELLADNSPGGTRLLLAYASYKDRGKYPTITFYEHDGLSTGKVTGTIPVDNLRSDSHPSLSHDGKLCAFTSEVENQTSRILLWDTQARQLVDLPVVNDSPNSQQHATISGNGGTLTFAAWNRPGFGNRWSIVSFDLEHKSLITPTDWNTSTTDPRMPAVSADRALLAFVSNADGGGPADIRLWDTHAMTEIQLPGLNSPSRDVEPSPSADGQLICFVSDRSGGVGARDIYLYDRRVSRLLSLPGLNSVAHEQMPSLSPDGRYIAFVSERRAGAGERDIFIYDRATATLLPTPNLNSAREEIDPCIITLPAVR